MNQIKENIQFLRFEIEYGKCVAVINILPQNDEYNFDYASMLYRQQNLKKHNSPSEVTDYVIAAWPANYK